MSNQLLECSPVLHRYLLTFIWSSASQLNGERLHLRTSYSDRWELGLLPTSLQRTRPGWRTRTRVGKPEEWSTEDWKLRAENVSNSTLREKKMPENVPWAGKTIFRRRVFFCWNDKRQCHRSLGIIYYGFLLESALQKRTKNEQRINWSRSPLSRQGTCHNLWYKLLDRIEFGPTRRDLFCKYSGLISLPEKWFKTAWISSLCCTDFSFLFLFGDEI